MLNDKDIKEYIKSNKIKICGFIEDNIGPCSYDVRLGNEIIIYKNEVLDLEIENEYMKYKFNIGDKVLLCPAWKEYSNKEKEKLCKKYNCVEVFVCGILGSGVRCKKQGGTPPRQSQERIVLWEISVSSVSGMLAW
jgi:dCTP deaminase (dUMP-forming)